MPLTAKAPKMPDDLAMATAEADDMMGAELSMAMPKPDRPYSPKVVTNLAKAVAKLVGLMGVELVPEPYTGAVEALGEDEVRFLSMLEAAAAEYGQPFPMPLSAIKGDAELTVLTAYLTQLAADKGFAAFMDEGMDEGMNEGMDAERGMDEGMDAERGMDEGMDAERGVDDDDYFASRV